MYYVQYYWHEIFLLQRMKSVMIYSIQFIRGFVFFLLHYQPLPESVALVEDIVVEYITDLVSTSFGTPYLLLSMMTLMVGLCQHL